MAGVFDRTIAGWRGIPQSVECVEYLDPSPGSDRRVWIVPAFAHPVGTAAMLPGFGPGWLDTMRAYPYTGALVAMVHDESAGRVLASQGRPVLDYALTAGDRRQLARGMAACGEILFAAGARQVIVPTAVPMVARTAGALRAVTEEIVRPAALAMTAVHPMGGMCAGADPTRSVCDPTGQHHQVMGLWVADGGILPTSIGTPPQVTIYTVGMKVGRTVGDWLRRG